MEREIEEALRKNLDIEELEIENLSHLHKTHEYGGSDNSHFKIRIVSKSFSKMNLVQMHKEVYKILEFAFDEGVHAIELDTISPV